MARLPGVNRELAAAVRRTNALYRRIPEHRRPNIDGARWLELERAIDRACAAGDEAGALEAIAEWLSHAEHALGLDAEDAA